MSLFHIVHVIPDPRLHILNGYNDVIKTIIWGLRCHGHEVSYAINQPRLGARNVVFGANMAPAPLIDALPDDTILYNLEQVTGMKANGPMLERLRLLARRFTIWDYDLGNIGGWREIDPAARAIHGPIGYAPALTVIPKAERQDIDVLIYGGPSERRLGIFTELCLQGVTSLFCFGLYDTARDELIARSKLVLNISHSGSRVFSIVRAFYLLANRKAVVADARPDMAIENDIAAGMRFADIELFTQACLELLRDPAAREELEERGFDLFRARDIRVIVGHALALS